jgi:hypothetical protein
MQKRMSGRRIVEPSPSEVVSHLAGLNTISQMQVAARGQRAKSIAIASYLQWFRARGIAICKDDGVWQLEFSLRDD